jgi:hypothetical protein
MHRAVLASLVVVYSSSAVAQPAPAAPEPAPAPTSLLWIGPQLDLMPSGSVTAQSGSNPSVSADLDSAIGLGGVIEYRVSPLITVGLAPRFATPIKVHNASDSGNQLDVRARVTVGKEVAPRFRLHGIATLGYSWIFHLVCEMDQNGACADYLTVKGVVFGFGAGMYYTISPRLLFSAEISYQIGRQGTTFNNADLRASDDYLTLGFGLLTPLD